MARRSGLRFVAGLGLNVVGGALERAASGSLRVEGADELTLFLAAATGYTAYDLTPVEDPVMLRHVCRGVLLRLHCKPYPLLRARHVGEHRALFNRCWLHLGGDWALSRPPPTNASKPCAMATQTKGCPRCYSTMVAIS